MALQLRDSAYCTRLLRLQAVVVLLATLGLAAGAAEPKHDRGVTFRVDIELGADRGQSPGALFEALDRDGRLIAGAGFHDVYNTHFRTNHRTLQFYVRPAGVSPEPEVTRLPHPDLGTGVYLFDVDQRLYAWTSIGENSVRRWDAAAETWRRELPVEVASVRAGDGATRVGAGLLTFSENEARYDGALILRAPSVGTRHNFYYANGYLCYFHRLAAESGAFTHVCACPWSPGVGEIDAERAIVLDTKYDHEATFAWGQWEDQVLTVSNSGGVYVLEDNAWRVVREPDRNVSYQVYSMLRWRDGLLLAQYPTGHVFEYRGQSPVEIPDWPPRLAEVSPSARECQTLAVYGGDLYAGVWPWAELWRLDGSLTAADAAWQSLGRMLTHPETTNATVHPYEADALRSGLVLNHWGQRLCSMVPLGDSLYVATSSKGTAEWKEEYGFLTNEQRREYGAVLRLRVPGNLAVPIHWRDGSTRLEFVVGAGSIRIVQDGNEIATTTFDGAISLDDIHVTWGNGMHGPLRGTLGEHAVETTE